MLNKKNASQMPPDFRGRQRVLQMDLLCWSEARATMPTSLFVLLLIMGKEIIWQHIRESEHSRHPFMPSSLAIAQTDSTVKVVFFALNVRKLSVLDEIFFSIVKLHLFFFEFA